LFLLFDKSIKAWFPKVCSTIKKNPDQIICLPVLSTPNTAMAPLQALFFYFIGIFDKEINQLFLINFMDFDEVIFDKVFFLLIPVQWLRIGTKKT